MPKNTSNSLLDMPIAINNIVGIYPTRRTSQTSLDSANALSLLGLPNTSISSTKFRLITSTNTSSTMAYYILIVGY